MLKAAIAVVLNGPDSLKSIQYPFGDGPFEYTAVGTGFQLKSKFAFEGSPSNRPCPERNHEKFSRAAPGLRRRSQE